MDELEQLIIERVKCTEMTPVRCNRCLMYGMCMNGKYSFDSTLSFQRTFISYAYRIGIVSEEEIFNVLL